MLKEPAFGGHFVTSIVVIPRQHEWMLKLGRRARGIAYYSQNSELKCVKYVGKNRAKIVLSE